MVAESGRANQRAKEKARELRARPVSFLFGQDQKEENEDKRIREIQPELVKAEDPVREVRPRATRAKPDGKGQANATSDETVPPPAFAAQNAQIPPPATGSSTYTPTDRPQGQWQDDSWWEGEWSDSAWWTDTSCFVRQLSEDPPHNSYLHFIYKAGSRKNWETIDLQRLLANVILDLGCKRAADSMVSITRFMRAALAAGVQCETPPSNATFSCANSQTSKVNEKRRGWTNTDPLMYTDFDFREEVLFLCLMSLDQRGI